MSEKFFKVYYKEHWASNKWFMEARIVSEEELEKIKGNKNIQLISEEVFTLHPRDLSEDY